MKTRKNIFFDLDGTIVNSFPQIKASLIKSFKENDVEILNNIREEIIGPTLDEIIFYLNPKCKNKMIKSLISSYREIYFESCSSSYLYKDAADVLKFLSKNNDLYVVTNKSKKPTLKILIKNKIDHFFKGIFCVDKSHHLYNNKSDLISFCLSNLSLDKSTSYYVGDTLGDYEASSKNNINFVFADWGYGSLHVKNSLKVKNFQELKKILK